LLEFKGAYKNIFRHYNFRDFKYNDFFLSYYIFPFFFLCNSIFMLVTIHDYCNAAIIRYFR